jgi:hypothetical protein
VAGIYAMNFKFMPELAWNWMLSFRIGDERIECRAPAGLVAKMALSDTPASWAEALSAVTARTLRKSVL